jgi:uncharacterized protein YndB with AHSA1/START domain
MSDSNSAASTRNSKVIKASRESLYRAFTDPVVLAAWLAPPTRIVQAISFDSQDPAFSGEMTMEVTFEERDGGTDVTIVFDHIPPGIRPEDNEAGTRSSLEKLARYIGDERVKP